MKRYVYAVVILVYWTVHRNFRRGKQYARNLIKLGMPSWLKRLFKEEQLPFRYNWRLTAYYKGTNKVAKVLEGENLIMTVGKQQVGDMLIDTAGYDTGITYCALGADNTAPAVGQTQLVDEGGGAAMRLAITYKSRLINVITLSTFFTAAQSTLAIEEAGIFGHDADGVENSGIMFSRWLVSFDNSGALYDITVTYILTIG